MSINVVFFLTSIVVVLFSTYLGIGLVNRAATTLTLQKVSSLVGPIILVDPKKAHKIVQHIGETSGAVSLGRLLLWFAVQAGWLAFVAWMVWR